MRCPGPRAAGCARRAAWPTAGAERSTGGRRGKDGVTRWSAGRRVGCGWAHPPVQAYRAVVQQQVAAVVKVCEEGERGGGWGKGKAGAACASERQQREGPWGRDQEASPLQATTAVVETIEDTRCGVRGLCGGVRARRPLRQGQTVKRRRCSAQALPRDASKSEGKAGERKQRLRRGRRCELHLQSRGGAPLRGGRRQP